MSAIDKATPLSMEPCAECGGTGERTVLENFLLIRLRHHHDYRWVGRSADAMILAAVTGEEPTAYPHDGWDLGRCMVTRAVAPPELHERMDELIARWEQWPDRPKPYWGTDAARQMVEDHLEDVCALVEGTP